MSDFLSSVRLRRMDGKQIVQGGVLGLYLEYICPSRLFKISDILNTVIRVGITIEHICISG